MNRYTIYCTPSQTRKAIELGVPILLWKGFKATIVPTGSFIENNILYFIPTAEQMIGWLEEQGFRFEVEFTVMYCMMVHINNTYIGSPICANSRKEATLSAIDAALEYLTNKK